MIETESCDKLFAAGYKPWVDSQNCTFRNGRKTWNITDGGADRGQSRIEN